MLVCHQHEKLRSDGFFLRFPGEPVKQFVAKIKRFKLTVIQHDLHVREESLNLVDIFELGKLRQDLILSSEKTTVVGGQT